MLKLLIAFLLIIGSSYSGSSQSFMTYNIRYDSPHDQENRWQYRKAALVDLLKEYHPTVFGVQEGLHHQVMYLDSSLTHHAFVGVGRDDGQHQGEYSALFFDSTAVHVLGSGTFWLSETPEQISVGWDASMERICTWGKFQVINSNRSFYVFNTHFDHRGPQARAQSALLILRKMAELNKEKHPIVLMGDFNAVSEEEPIKNILSAMEDGLDLFAQPIVGPIGTFNGFDNRALDRRIDYIFTKGFKVESYQHINKRRAPGLFLSDHLPVYLKAKQINTR